MSKNETKLRYEVFSYIFNKEHGLVFVPKNPRFNLDKISFTLSELGSLGLELIQCVENRQTNGHITNRIAIFLYVE